MAEVVRVKDMKRIEDYKEIFDRGDGMLRTQQLSEENITYRPLQKLIEQGYVEKIRYGYYQWVDHDDFSEAGTVIRLFPDAISSIRITSPLL